MSDGEPIRGRGAARNPRNRFLPLYMEPDPGARDPDDPGPDTLLLRDATRSAIARNTSPDIGFETSLNPYRGCEHGCIYCYARPTHEYLGFSAGLDFETRILVKENLPELLRAELSSSRWKPQPVIISGVTDPYQPAERKLKLTRRCLRVFAEFRNPVALITKNHLVTRDVDILAELAASDCASVTLSITTLDPELQRIMEPRTAIPARRLKAIETLAAAGVPVGVNVAPVIPGLTDHEMPAILQAAYDAGASEAGYVMLRLPYAVAPLFQEWLQQHFPDRKEKVLNRLRNLRGGKLYDASFGSRMRGGGPFAEQVRAVFEVSRRRTGIERRSAERRPLATAAFRCPARPGSQIGLFE